jgi:hypothetical protein
MLITHLTTTLASLPLLMNSTLIPSRGDFVALVTSLTSLLVLFYGVLMKMPSLKSLLLSTSLQKSSSCGVAEVQLAKSETLLSTLDPHLSATRPSSRRNENTLCLRRFANFTHSMTLAGTLSLMRFVSSSTFGLPLMTSTIQRCASGKIMRTRRLTLAQNHGLRRCARSR